MKLHKWQMVIGGTLSLLTVAFFLHVYPLYYMAAAWGLLVPLSCMLTRLNLGNLTATRSVPRQTAVGEPVKVTITVRNHSRRRRFLFAVEDELPDGLTSDAKPKQLVTDLPPKASRSISYRLIPTYRGVYSLSEIMLSAPDLLGMYEFSRALPEINELVVYPKPIPLPPIWTPSATGRSGQTTMRRKSREGVDLYGVREYLPGDDLRRIHWKASAHADELIITEREQQRSLSTTVLLDLDPRGHAGQTERSSLEYAVTLAASLLVQALQQRAPAQLIADGSRDFSVPLAPPGAGKEGFLEALARVQGGGNAELNELAHKHRTELVQAGSVAVITPQVGTQMLKLATTLRGWGNSVIWLALAAPTFESTPTTEASIERYRSFMQTLRRGGCPAYLIRGDCELAASFRGWRRAAV